MSKGLRWIPETSPRKVEVYFRQMHSRTLVVHAVIEHCLAVNKTNVDANPHLWPVGSAPVLLAPHIDAHVARAGCIEKGALMLPPPSGTVNSMAMNGWPPSITVVAIGRPPES
jgi:hypothetical protein